LERLSGAVQAPRRTILAMARADADLSLAEHANAFAAHHDGWEDFARAYASASELLFLVGVALLLTAGALLGRRRLTSAGLLAVASAGVGLAVAHVASIIAERPRPFVAHRAIHAFLPHAADGSFPSDHATAAFAIGGALTLRLGVRAVPVLIAAAALAVSRVMLGVHYPSDVIAGALIGLAAAVTVCELLPRALGATTPGGPTRTRLAAHRTATLAARALLRLRPRGGEDRVHFLLMHAWGMGGTIRTTLNVAGYLADHNDVEVLSVVRRRKTSAFELPGGVTVTAIDDQRGSRRRGMLHRLLTHAPSLLMHPADHSSKACTLWTDVQLVRALWRVRSGVLIGTRPALNLLAVQAARPGLAAVGQEHVNLAAQPPPIRQAIRSRYRDLDAFVTLTEADRQAYADFLGDSARVTAIPNAVPPIDGGRSPLTGRTLVAAGRLTPQKGFDRLIRAFATIAADCPDWTLRICGGGPKRRRLERLVQAHGMTGRVLLVGRTDRIGDELAAASLFVLSSRFEGFPMALIEAMSKGLPCVAFDCPTGPREIVRTGRNGILVPDRDEQALAGAMLELINDPGRRRELGRAAAEDALAYSLEAIGPHWDRLLDDLVTAARQGSGDAGLSPGGPPRTLRPAGRRSQR
jgi:glycosyltransferase involved in cell wall biosynthesis/membrane-associated phospholipid phosphatase